MEQPLRIGIFGAGNFANKQHIPNLIQIDNVEIVAVCDIDEKAARATAESFDIPRIYTDGHEMLDKEPMDAMWSVVPAFARTDVEATAASKGIHLFSEKPQALEMKIACRIDEAIREAGVFSTVGFRERYRPIFQEARRLLSDKEIVHIRFQSIRNLPEPRNANRWNAELEKGGSAFFDWGPHAVDYSRFMSGLDIITAQAFFTHDSKRHRAPTSANPWQQPRPVSG